MEDPQQVDKQLAEMGENSSANVNVKSITNIYYDCLERIFEFLDLDSLLSVANTCKRLQIAAVAYYGDIYGKHCVTFRTQRSDSGIVFRYDRIDVYRLDFCLPFLRCFGPKILDLHAFVDNDFVDRYVNQYCAKTLKRITFMNTSVFSIANFPNPFECVEVVNVGFVKLKVQFPHFVNLFPKLRSLSMQHVYVDGNCTAVHFPNLECLLIRSGSEVGFTMKNVVDLLHANPQLQTLDLTTSNQEITVNELLNTLSQNPSITKLKVWTILDINPVDLMRFASERPYTVELHLSGHTIPPQDAINFIRELKSLKMFQFLIKYQADYDHFVSQLDSEWKHTCWDTLSGEHFIRLER